MITETVPITPAPPPAPHPGDAFHAHMLACQQCGEHRFHLCEDGQVLYATMLRDWPGAELGQDKFQRATAAQSAVESWYKSRFYKQEA